jgi:hypothetical protein
LQNFLIGIARKFISVEDTECPFDEVAIPLSDLRTLAPTPSGVSQPPNQYDMTNAIATIRASDCLSQQNEECNSSEKCRFWCSEFGGIEDSCLQEIDVRLTLSYTADVEIEPVTATLALSGNGYGGSVEMTAINIATGNISEQYVFSISLIPDFCDASGEPGASFRVGISHVPGRNISLIGDARSACGSIPFGCIAETIPIQLLRVATAFTSTYSGTLEILC